MTGGGGEFLDVPAVDVAYQHGRQTEVCRVSALRVRQIPAFTRAYGPLIEAALADKPGTLTVLDLIEKDRDACIAIAVAASDLPESTLRRNFSLPDFARLLQTIFDVNRDLFSARKAPKAQGGAPVVWGWEDSIQHLVAAGHREPDVLEYTAAKLAAYGEAVERQQRAMRAIALLDARATQYDEKDFKAHFKSLING